MAIFVAERSGEIFGQLHSSTAYPQVAQDRNKGEAPPRGQHPTKRLVAKSQKRWFFLLIGSGENKCWKKSYWPRQRSCWLRCLSARQLKSVRAFYPGCAPMLSRRQNGGRKKRLRDTRQLHGIRETKQRNRPVRPDLVTCRKPLRPTRPSASKPTASPVIKFAADIDAIA